MGDAPSAGDCQRPHPLALAGFDIVAMRKAAGEEIAFAQDAFLARADAPVVVLDQPVVPVELIVQVDLAAVRSARPLQVDVELELVRTGLARATIAVQRRSHRVVPDGDVRPARRGGAVRRVHARCGRGKALSVRRDRPAGPRVVRNPGCGIAGGNGQGRLEVGVRRFDPDAAEKPRVELDPAFGDADHAAAQPVAIGAHQNLLGREGRQRGEQHGEHHPAWLRLKRMRRTGHWTRDNPASWPIDILILRIGGRARSWALAQWSFVDCRRRPVPIRDELDRRPAAEGPRREIRVEPWLPRGVRFRAVSPPAISHDPSRHCAGRLRGG